MATKGPISPTTGADVDTGNIPWTLASRILSSNNSYATVGLGFASAESSNDLTGTFDFTGDPIPSGATIDGIEFGVELKASVAATALNTRTFFTYDGASPSGSTLSGGSFLVSTTEGVVTLGGPTDLGGNTITEADINAGTTGIMIAFTNVGVAGVTISVDYISMTVYYTSPTGIRGLATMGVGI